MCVWGGGGLIQGGAVVCGRGVYLNGGAIRVYGCQECGGVGVGVVVVWGGGASFRGGE